MKLQRRIEELETANLRFQLQHKIGDALSPEEFEKELPIIQSLSPAHREHYIPRLKLARTPTPSATMQKLAKSAPGPKEVTPELQKKIVTKASTDNIPYEIAARSFGIEL